MQYRNNSYLNKLCYEWFVRYNPLYFVSAACFIFGVLLVSKGISDIDWIDGQIILTGVIEFYQILALAGSFILCLAPIAFFFIYITWHFVLL